VQKNKQLIPKIKERTNREENQEKHTQLSQKSNVKQSKSTWPIAATPATVPMLI